MISLPPRIPLTDGPVIIAGVGASFGVSRDEVRALLTLALDQAGIPLKYLSALVTVDSKAREDGLVALAAELDIPLLAHQAEKLAEVHVPHPSAQVRDAVGTASVAEASAMLGAPEWSARRLGASVELIVGKTASPRATVAIARHWLADLRHHGDQELAPGMLDLAVNVSTEPVPSWLTDAIGSAVTDLSHYPDARAATAAVAASHGRSEAEVLLTAGAAEAFTLIAQSLIRFLSNPKAVVVHPQFTEPEVALRAAQWPMGREVLRVDDWFALHPARVPADANVVVVGNPTNPTGTLHPVQRILRLRKPGRILVVDEAFMDSVPDETESMLAHRDLTGVLVIRSLTKTWGLAGLRIGYLVGDPELIAAAAEVQPHWSVSSPALAAATVCVSDEARVEATRRAELVCAERERLRSALRSRQFTVAPESAGPFLLTRHPGRPELHRELREADIAVRRADTFPGLGAGWVRVSVRDAAVTDRLLAVIDA